MKFKFLIFFIFLFIFWSRMSWGYCLKIECSDYYDFRFNNNQTFDFKNVSSLNFSYNELKSSLEKKFKILNVYRLLIKDWQQTLKIAGDPNFYEKNKILGEKPSNFKIHMYFATNSLLFSWLALSLPEPHSVNLIESMAQTEEINVKNTEDLFNGEEKNGKLVSFVLFYTFNIKTIIISNKYNF